MDQEIILKIIEYMKTAPQISPCLLQRKFKINYKHAKDLCDYFELCRQFKNENPNL